MRSLALIALAGCLGPQLDLTIDGEGHGVVATSIEHFGCAEKSCAIIVENSVPITLTAQPAVGSTFAGWSGEQCSGFEPCTVELTTNTTIGATFDVEQHELAIAKLGTGAGAVASSDGGIACGPDCTDTYAHGSKVTLTATAEPGSRFVSWSERCAGSGSAVCELEIIERTGVTANFALDQSLAVTLAGTGEGTVTSTPGGIACGTDCVEVYPFNTTVTLVATPSADSRFVGWSGACGGSSVCTVTVDRATSVTATFETQAP